jgi:3-oxoacyl-[acyl-carrier protein] reductase
MEKRMIAWVSGANGDIGSAIVEQLALEGTYVAALTYRRRERISRLAERFAHVQPFAVDVRDRQSVEEAYRAITLTWGQPSILVHAAGRERWGLFLDEKESDLEEMMRLHVHGAFHLTQVSLPAMLRERKGRIIYISSIWGETGAACEVLYSMAKGSINAMTKALAKEVASTGITVNAVAPGAVAGEMLEKQVNSEEEAALRDEIPMGRFAEPKEIAHLVTYLCRPEAEYITGQIMHINGGWYT